MTILGLCGLLALLAWIGERIHARERKYAAISKPEAIRMIARSEIKR